MPQGKIVTNSFFFFCGSVGSLCYVATLMTAGQQASLRARNPAARLPDTMGKGDGELSGSSVIVLLFWLEINHGVELLGSVPVTQKP